VVWTQVHGRRQQPPAAPHPVLERAAAVLALPLLAVQPLRDPRLGRANAQQAAVGQPDGGQAGRRTPRS
jgi:hypothetical protein